MNDCFKALGWTPETKDHLEKDCQKRGKAGLKSWNVAKATGGMELGGQCDGFMCLLTRNER